jgi:hypothetical protein
MQAEQKGGEKTNKTQRKGWQQIYWVLRRVDSADVYQPSKRICRFHPDRCLYHVTEDGGGGLDEQEIESWKRK